MKEPADPKDLPQAGRAPSRFGDISPGPSPLSPSVPSSDDSSRPLLPSGPEYFVSSVAALLAVVVMLGGAAFYILNVLHQRSPSTIVPQLAKNHLDALSANNYAYAYLMLTRASRIHCTLEEFRLLSDTPQWSWSNLSVVSIEPDAVVMEYDLTPLGRRPVRTSLIFAYDHGRWARPYNRPALLHAQEALARGDAEVALMSALQAIRLDPRDPAARASLCAADRALKLVDRAESDCRVVDELARRYPSSKR